MKKQKRDKSSRAYSRGYQAGLQGKSRDICPFTGAPIRHSWLTGWREGRNDQWESASTTDMLHSASG